jgi:hypothetical protein
MIVIEDRTMPPDHRAILQTILEADPEAWARLKGAMAVLALPSVRCEDRAQATRLIEIEVDGAWEIVDRVTVTPEAVIFAHGVNGHTRRWPFDRHAIPQWRIARPR